MKTHLLILLYRATVRGLPLLLPILSNAAAAREAGLPSLGLSVFSGLGILERFDFLFFNQKNYVKY